MKTKVQLSPLISCLLLVVLMVACGQARKEAHSILPSGMNLRVGDVVFRRGGGFESHAVVSLDAHGQFSHVGIVVDTLGRRMVVHAVPGEPDFEGDEDRVKLDEVDTFFSSVYANKGAVMRGRDSIVARRAADVALGVYRRRVLFDHAYDSADTTKMYCTELVMYAYERAGVRLVTSAPHGVSLPVVTSDIFFPSDVYESKWLDRVIDF